jgi:uncharacterized protein (TIGR03083 family)
MPLTQSLTQQECLTAIAKHSAGFADIAAGNLDAEVEFCPGWTVRDLVHHVTQVHWFWATIVEEGRTERPDDLGELDKAPDDTTIETFHSGADRLIRVLGTVDPAKPVWTWAPAQQDAAFVIRHQVQEIVGHHWDAAHAAGRGIDLAPNVAADSVDEFLHFSVSNADDVDDPLPPALDGRFGVACTDSDAAWVLADGNPPGTVAVSATSSEALRGDEVATVTGTGRQLLLWLYDRHGDPSGDADLSAVDPPLLQRFRALCYTD